MPWYTYILLGIYLICCFTLIGVVLLQSGKGDIASAFGGGGSQTAFGPRSAASTLSRVTMGAAALFMILSFVFTLPGVMTAGSVAYGIKDAPTAVKPATPAPSPAVNPTASPAPAVTGKPAASPVVTGDQKPAANAEKPATAEKPAPAKPEEKKPEEKKPEEKK